MKGSSSLFRQIVSGSLVAGAAVMLSASDLGAAAHTPYSKIVVFGDSLSDMGNYFQATGMNAPPYYQGRRCNGPLWIEYVADQLRMEIDPADNYAIDGATTGRDNENDDDFGIPMDFPGLLDQVDAFLADSAETGVDPDALYVVWAGANDFVILAESGGDPAQVIAEGVANLAYTVQTLAGAGAQHILVLNLPDLGLTPLATLSGQSGVLSFLVSLYNQALDRALDQLSVAGIPTIRVHADAVLQSMVFMPELYGFTNVSDPYFFVGAGDPDEFVFVDILHPTTAAHAVLADAVVDSVLKFYSPRGSVRRGNGKGAVRCLNGLVNASSHH